MIHDKLSDNPKYRNVFVGVYKIIAEQGVAGVYKGYSATLMKQSSNQGIRFLVYEDTNKFLGHYIKQQAVANFLAGGFAGFCSVVCNNPIDVVKTNL